MNNIIYKLIEFVIFITPLLYLGQTFDIILCRLIIYTILLLCILSKVKLFFIRRYWPIHLLWVSALYYAWRTHIFIGCLPSIELSYCLYAFTLSNAFQKNEKKILIDKLCKGMLFAGLLGIGYMFFNNLFIKGGTYTENALNISNITVPIYLSIYIIYCILKNIFRNKWKITDMILIVCLFFIILFLEKRGVILFLILVAALFFIKPLLRLYYRFSKIILIVIFLFPLYELTLIQYIIDTGYVEEYFERSEDFSDIEENPRINRLIAASEFITDFQMIDLFGYHDEIQLSKLDDDLAHEHFHNTFLQLYYERGLLAIILFIFLICYMKNKSSLDIYNSMAQAIILYLMFVGTNEDMLMTGSLYEIIIYFLMLYNSNNN